MLEAATRDDATAKVPTGSCLADDCDCDKDKFLRAGFDAGTRSDAQVDCDDLDPLRNPAAGLTETAPEEGITRIRRGRGRGGWLPVRRVLGR